MPRALVLVLVIALGCSKKHETPDPPMSDNDIDRLRDPSIVPGRPAPVVGGPTVSSEAEAIAIDTAVTKQVLDIFAADGTDCDKLATDLTTVLADPKLAALNAYAEAHPSFQRKPDAAEAKLKEAAARASEKCATNKRYMNAVASF